MIGDELLAADHVRYLGYCVGTSDIDLLRDLDRVVDFDAKVATCALDLWMPQQELIRSLTLD